MTEYLSYLFPQLFAVAGDRGIRRHICASVSGSYALSPQTKWGDQNFQCRRRKIQGQHGNKLLTNIHLKMGGNQGVVLTD